MKKRWLSVVAAILLLSACGSASDEAVADRQLTSTSSASAVLGDGAEVPALDFKDLCDSFVLKEEGVDALFFVEPDDFSRSLQRITAQLDADPSLAYTVTAPDDALADLSAVLGMAPDEFAQQIALPAQGLIEVTRQQGQPPGRDDPVIAALLTDPAIFSYTLASDAVGEAPSPQECF